MTIFSLIYISIVTFRKSELQKFKKLTSRVPIFGIQEVKEIDFKNSGFRNTVKSRFHISIFYTQYGLCITALYNADGYLITKFKDILETFPVRY